MWQRISWDFWVSISLVERFSDDDRVHVWFGSLIIWQYLKTSPVWWSQFRSSGSHATCFTNWCCDERRRYKPYRFLVIMKNPRSFKLEVVTLRQTEKQQNTLVWRPLSLYLWRLQQVEKRRQLFLVWIKRQKRKTVEWSLTIRDSLRPERFLIVIRWSCKFCWKIL